MTIDEIVKLIEAVSENGLTSFSYEEGNQKLILKKKKKKNVAQAPVAPVVISQPAPQMMSPMAVPMAQPEIPAMQSAPAQRTLPLRKTRSISDQIKSFFLRLSEHFTAVQARRQTLSSRSVTP